MRKRLYIFILLCWLVGIFSLMLVPMPPVPDAVKRITLYDKAAHLVFFAVTNFLFLTIIFKFKKFNFFVSAVISSSFSLFLALLAEELQSFVPGRETSSLDFLAGAVGVAISCPLAYIFNHDPRKKLALHVCCAPCTTAVWEVLATEYNIEFFFSNANIFPKNEYNKRLKELKVLAKRFGAKVSEDKYSHRAWKKTVAGMENDREGGGRCEACFLFRLNRASLMAKRGNFDFFATTLSISPHKNTEMVNRCGREASEKNGICFLEKDFKENGGFARSLELSKKFGLYRQKYCGCEFSLPKKKKI
jgi:predicted adenine nucleotide alpha hydrolase (AANH) superfamily ATPase/VanZ family protein